MMTFNEAVCMVDPTLSVKIALGVYLFGNTILSLGTERHHPIFKAVWNKQVYTDPVMEVTSEMLEIIADFYIGVFLIVSFEHKFFIVISCINDFVKSLLETLELVQL